MSNAKGEIVDEVVVVEIKKFVWRLKTHITTKKSTTSYLQRSSSRGKYICELRLCISTSEIKSLRTERSKETLQLHRSLALFIHPNGTYTSPPSPASPHDGLVVFRTRQHYPITPNSTSLDTLFCSSIGFLKENRDGRSII